MKTYLLSLLAAGLIFASCSRNHGNQALPYHVNLERDIRNIRSVPLSTLGSTLVYIPLETDSACMIEKISNVSVTDSFVFVSDSRRLLLFDLAGKYLRQIGSAGRGPGEYLNIGNFIVDDAEREVYVLSPRVVLIYDFMGRFKRDFKLDFPTRQFVLKGSNEFILHPFNMSQPTSEPVYSWYITDNMGVVKNKIPNTLKRVNKGLIVPMSPLYMYNGTPHFMEFGVDTLYNYDNQVKKPYAVFQYGNLKMPPDPTMSEVPGINGKIWVSDVREIKKSLFVKVWWDLSDSISNCLFDKSSSEFIILKDNGFKNDIDGGMAFWPERIVDDNLLIGFADAFDLITYVKNNGSQEDAKQSEQLKNVVKQLNETSNPVIIILKK